MAITLEQINVGNTANDGTGDPLRTAFQIINSNFGLLENQAGVSGIANGTSNIQIALSGPIRMSSANVANVVTVTGTGVTIVGTTVANAISAVGNIVSTTGLFIGNGALLTNVPGTTNAADLIGNTLSANVTLSSLTKVGVLANLSASGNITGGNLITPGILSASGNATAQNLNTVGVVTATGNVVGGNLTTAGAVSAFGSITSSGNVSALFFNGNGSALTGVTATTSANALTGATLAATVLNSSLTTVGTLNYLVVANASGGNGNVEASNMTTGGIVSALGNVTGGNLITYYFRDKSW